jgi:branched-chain amino acid aminotransferase
VISALAKKEAEEAGYMEVLFLDAVERKYVEEGSSCNAFFYLNPASWSRPNSATRFCPHHPQERHRASPGCGNKSL